MSSNSNTSIAKKARTKAEADFATWLMMAKEGKVIIRRRLKRRFVIGFFRRRASSASKKCASSHHWSRSRLAIMTLVPAALRSL
jgi:hypothetical protein